MKSEFIKTQIGLRLPPKLNRRLEKLFNRIGFSKSAFILNVSQFAKYIKPALPLLNYKFSRTNFIALVEELHTSGEIWKTSTDLVFSLPQWANTAAYSKYYSLIFKTIADKGRINKFTWQITEDTRAGLKNPAQIIANSTAAGKTTFVWQIANQLANQGETVIFCSYEITQVELITKTIALKLYLKNICDN